MGKGKGRWKRQREKDFGTTDVMTHRVSQAVRESVATVMSDVEVVGVLLTRPPRPNSPPAFRVCVDKECGLSGEELECVSRAVRTAIRTEAPQKSHMEVRSAGRTVSGGGGEEEEEEEEEEEGEEE